MEKKRKKTPIDTKQLVLHEAGYKCANPACRHIITLDIHHLEYVSNGGSDDPENLLPLCPNCHALHHAKKIPITSLRAWKMLLLAFNEAFDRKSIDILLALSKQGIVRRITGDGVMQLAALIASDMIEIKEYPHQIIGTSIPVSSQVEQMYCVSLTNKGYRLVENWKKGDQEAAVRLV